MQGLEPANLDMVLSIASVTDSPHSVAAGTVSEKENPPVCTYCHAPKGWGWARWVMTPVSSHRHLLLICNMKKRVWQPRTCPQPSSPALILLCPALPTQIKPCITLPLVSTTTSNQIYKRVRIYSSVLLSSGPPPVRNFTQELHVFRWLVFPPFLSNSD